MAELWPVACVTHLQEPLPRLTEENWRTVSACKPYQLCTEMKELQVGKLTYAIYKLGMKVLRQDNRQLEQTLNDFIERHRGQLRQNPMVTGGE